jgi:predicted RNA binding protein YcfA (HicA-like mRNA interferase family)
MTDIDYEALAKAAYEAASPSACSCGDFDFDLSARAVVAALTAQGFVVVRADDVHAVITHSGGDSTAPWDSYERLESALAAPSDGGEHP